MSWYRWHGEDLELALRVQTRAPRDDFVGVDPSGDYYRVRIQSPPVDGKGNQSLKRFIAEEFGVAPSHITLLSGEHARYKRLRIQRPRLLPIAVVRPAATD
ncbi:DUF167 domain-containing protein [Chromatium okenii]|jgi:hypothetical protein|uniref:UPF0235 protein CXB77_13760 n=1 Tax=Chromatium okenii TaxID=61644 RepID=A0A2S7XNK5_9GAMM|nr:DUF167 family protein [Chromatium okenii]MBV5307789.1 DUF167 domain-containing protein [Chromatium okenii]PQJ95305.1 hypothetical protein CXB77_13760 [Chromatium okenii]